MKQAEIEKAVESRATLAFVEAKGYKPVPVIVLGRASSKSSEWVAVHAETGETITAHNPKGHTWGAKTMRLQSRMFVGEWSTIEKEGK